MKYPVLLLLTLQLAVGHAQLNLPKQNLVVPGSEWAFPLDPDVELPHRMPGSSQSFSKKQILDPFTAIDWFPNEHPAMPSLVATGVKPTIWACAYCHLPNGAGRPENAPLAGLSVFYIKKQLEEFSSGARTSSEVKFGPSLGMIYIAKTAINHPDIPASAMYFSSIKLTPMINVVETNTVPKTVVENYAFKKAEGSGHTQLGDRIIELPEDQERSEFRDSHLQYTAFVPKGSVAKGAALVKTGLQGKTIACQSCHGENLKGGSAPPIAGRFPGYQARQLFNFKSGARNGIGADQMREVVKKLSPSDIRSIVAYLATLHP